METNKEYIDYLNSLHNYNAQNPNAYAEKNVDNPFFSKVAVKVNLCDYLIDIFSNAQSQIVVLTGHAGDGKTSIMYQVLKHFNFTFDKTKPCMEFDLPNGKKIRCIKDFSEYAENERLKLFQDCINFSENNFVFMVANTGPLIKTYTDLFPDEEKDQAHTNLIDAMNENKGTISSNLKYKINIINVATVNNTYFASKFLNNIISDELWTKCASCDKRGYCYILKNRNIIYKNKKSVFDFLNYHYNWLTEHGKRLTIRSMTEQLAYMITGSSSCESIKSYDDYRFLFSNLFFGYVGLKEHQRALNIMAVKDAYNCKYFEKRLRIDEELLINQNFDKLFSEEVVNIINEALGKYGRVNGWNEFLRRTYLFLNINNTPADKEIYNQLIEDVFSTYFNRYLDLTTNESALISKQDSALIVDALSMLYIGAITNSSEIPLTMSRESGIAQNVQLKTGEIHKKKISIIKEETKDSVFNKNNKRYHLLLKIDKNVLANKLTLPLINYFEELKNGIISTNVDPQLTHGIESLKAVISRDYSEIDDTSTLDIVILKNNGNVPYSLDISDGKTIREA